MDTSPPFEGLEETGGEQGEILVLPLRFVVAPDHGRFHPAVFASTVDGTQTVARGTLIGEVRNGTTHLKVHSPFDGRVDRWLVSAGQVVTPGQPLCSLNPQPSSRTAGEAGMAVTGD
jgi:multidrug efflux pump subunit AcrA (membrane-fusion protein)